MFSAHRLTRATKRTIIHSRAIRSPNIPTRLHGIRTNSNSAPEVTKIEKIIFDNIKATGPLPFATYMQLCLSHPTHGYYMNASNPVFGSRGDFITSPEISQVFGELVGIWLLSRWIASGRPDKVRLIELGPGRGTLMDDILRVISQLGPTISTLDVHLVETSQVMRSLQEEKLRPVSQKLKVRQIHWHNSISEIPRSASEYTMFVAHEFFDALPIHILQKTDKGWNEVLVGANKDYDPSKSTPASKGQFRHILSPNPSAASTVLGLSSPRFSKLPIGSTIEVSPSAFKIARQAGELLSESTEDGQKGPGGCGLIIDYGNDKVFGDSFRAFKEHKIVDVFHRPGECDLTANVDFAYLKEAMVDIVETHGPIPQYAFLEKMGLQLRVDALIRGTKVEERRSVIADAAKRLVDRIGMGKEYQVLGITSGESGPEKQVWPFIEEEKSEKVP